MGEPDMIKELKVDLGERSYPIYIGQGLLDEIGSYFDKHGISKASPLLIVTDPHVGPKYLKRITDNLTKAGYKAVSHTVASGEKSKSLAVLEEVVTTALEAGLDRKS